jgi:hypothetical protein
MVKKKDQAMEVPASLQFCSITEVALIMDVSKLSVEAFHRGMDVTFAITKRLCNRQGL